MNKKIIVSKAEMDDLSEIVEIYEKAIKHMNECNINQWDEVYPNENIFFKDILKKQLYVGRMDEEIVSVFCVNTEYNESYDTVEWQYPELKYKVIHRFCVKPEYQNQGIGYATMQVIDERLKAKGVQAVRMDYFSENPYAQKLLQKVGFDVVGEATWRKGLFYILEKKLV